MMMFLHDTLIPHAHPHLDPVVVAMVVAGLIFAGLLLKQLTTKVQ
jgi:hypothetical protein